MSLITTPRKVLRDLRGDILPPGLSHHRLDWSPVTDTLLPSWIVGSDGTFTVNTAATGVPGVTIVQTGAADAKLTIGPNITKDSQLAAVRLSLRGVRSLGNPDVNQVVMRMDDTAQLDGSVLTAKCASEQTLLTTRFGSATASQQASTHRFATNTAGEGVTPETHVFRACNMALMINYETNTVYGFEHDQVVALFAPGTQILRTGTVQPRALFKATSTTNLHISGISLDLWYF